MIWAPRHGVRSIDAAVLVYPALGRENHLQGDCWAGERGLVQAKTLTVVVEHRVPTMNISQHVSALGKHRADGRGSVGLRRSQGLACSSELNLATARRTLLTCSG